VTANEFSYTRTKYLVKWMVTITFILTTEKKVHQNKEHISQYAIK